MKYPKWQYRFLHNRLTEMGYKSFGLTTKHLDEPFYVGLYHKDKNIIHIEDMIKDYAKFVKEQTL